MISKRRGECTTLVHGGVCHRASTTHKRGNKMKKEKEKKKNIQDTINFIQRRFAHRKNISFNIAIIRH